jgi:hypothetical protein
MQLRLDPEWIVFKRTRTAADKHAVDASTLTQSQADAPSPEEEDDTVVIENRLEVCDESRKSAEILNSDGLRLLLVSH